MSAEPHSALDEMDRATIEGVRRISDGGRTNEEYIIDKLATEVERLVEQKEAAEKWRSDSITRASQRIEEAENERDRQYWIGYKHALVDEDVLASFPANRHPHGNPPILDEDDNCAICGERLPNVSELT